jgi:hypothetical protein
MTPARLDHTARHQAWTVDRGHQGFQWSRRLRLGRWRVGYHVYRHTYAQSPDRWVFQPYLTVDRKKVTSA